MQRPISRWLGIAFLICSPLVHADAVEDQRHWIARIGVHPIEPQTNNHPEFRVDNSVALSLSATYLVTKHWAVELFGTFPAEHDLRDVAGDRLGAFDQTPLTATIQYHVSDARSRMRAYVGIGAALAFIDDEQTTGALGSSSLRLDRSFGAAAAIGLDMNVSSRWFVNIDARWFDIDAGMTIDGASRGQLELDPFAFGLSLGRRLR